MSYALFDIGGTKTRVSVSEDLKTFSDPIKFKTPSDFDEGIEAIVDAVGKLTNKEVRGMAGGIRGPLNHDKTTIVYDVKLTDWVEKPITKRLEKKMKTKVYLENDTSVVGLGEAHFGAGKGHHIVVYHTVSTGVGGTRIIAGKIAEHHNGFEPGKQILDIDRTILGDDIEPTLENLVSGTALEERSGMKPYEIPQEDKIWDELAFYLGQGLKNSILYWAPDIIVLGGSMVVGDPRIFNEDIIRHTQEALGDLVPCPPIVDATLADNGGLYGAMALLQMRV